MNVKWEYWLELFLVKHCAARGLKANTIKSYGVTLDRFRLWAELRIKRDIEPDEIVAKDVLDFIKFLRDEKHNGDSAVNRQVVTLRMFYRAIVALEQLEHRKNPTHHLPRLRASKRKFKDTLTHEEVGRLLNRPATNTIIGLRDRAILALLYGTGVRASECSGLTEDDVDFNARTIRVNGKGGYQRVLPMNDSVTDALMQYQRARGASTPMRAFFRSRNKRQTTRGLIYERVRRLARLAHIVKHVTPHVLRHTFATHLVKMGEKLIVIRDLLGHRCLSSTQVYLHMTGEDLRAAVNRHPVGKLLDQLGDLLPKGMKLPFQHPPGTRFALNN